MRQFFYPVALLDDSGGPIALRGTAFPIAKDGGLLTCRHCVDLTDESGRPLPVGIIDVEHNAVVPVTESRFGDSGVDLAYLPNALRRPKEEFFPILEPDLVRMGEDTMTFGYYSMNGLLPANNGLFSGRIVSIQGNDAGFRRLTLPYPVIEGLSGSPVYTFHNGTKLLGVCFGSESQRILASEVVEAREGESKFTETVNRIVEFGLAHHGKVVVDFLEGIGVAPTVTAGSVDIPGLPK